MRHKNRVGGIVTFGLAMSAWLFGGLAAGTAQAAAPFYRAETAHFIVYSNAEQFSTRDYLSKLESFYVTASSLYLAVSDGAIEYKQKPTFYYVKTAQDDYTIFPRVKPNLGEFGPFILYSSCLDGDTNAYTDADVMMQDFDGDYRFVSANMFVKRVYLSRNLPTWVAQGLYGYVLNADIQKDKIVVGKPSVWQTLDLGDPNKPELLHDFVPFSQIIADNITSPKNTSALKAQYWLMVVHMMSSPENREKLYNYVQLVSSGRPSAEAFKEAIGLEPAFFEQLIKTYKAKGFPVIEFKVPALDPKTYHLEKLPDYGDAVPLLSAASQACPGQPYASAIIERLQKVASAMPNDIYVQRELARSQILLGQAKNAKAYLDAQGPTAADYDFNYLDGRYHLALAEDGGPDAAAHFAQARTSLAKAYKLNPTSGPILYHYARAFENQPDFPTANTIMAARQANEAMPGNYESYLNALLIKTGQMVAETTQSIKAKPSMSDYITRAFYRPDTETKEKLADLDLAIKLGPDSDRPYEARARLYLKLNDPAAALRDANQAVELNPNSVTALNTRALVYLKTSQIDLALKDLDKSVAENKGPDSLNEACWTLATQDFADKAMSYCNRALAQAQNDAKIRDSRALAELKLDQLDAAVEDYDRALAVGPNLPTSLYGRGLAKRKQGKTEAGDRDLAKARFIDPAIDMEFARDMGLSAP